MADPTMPENPEAPKAIIALDAGVEYTVTRQDAIFRNGQQVVIPHGGVNILHELLVVLTHMGEATLSGDADLIAGLTAPPEGADVPSQPGKVTMPPDVTDLSGWPMPHPSDMTWEGFEVKGSYNNGTISAEVEHRKLPISLTFTYDQAKWVIDHGDPDAGTAYEYLACQAFMAWWERNGLDVERTTLPDWAPGTMVEHTEKAGLYGVVVDYPGHDHLSILLPNRDLLPITEENAMRLSHYRPTK